VEGGTDANNASLYVARVKYNDGVHAAKIGEHLPGAHLAYGGTEVVVDVCTNSDDVFSQKRLLTPSLATGLRSVVLQLKGCNPRNPVCFFAVPHCIVTRCRTVEPHRQLK
jgi:hypothetical protein